VIVILASIDGVPVRIVFGGLRKRM
jgi:hypothetical protein